MQGKYNNEEVAKIIKTNSKCTLVSDYIGYLKPITLRCECGKIFERTWEKFYCNRRVRCNECASKVSQGEYYIEEYLKNNDINYEKQYIFPNCKNESYLRFDLCILCNNKPTCAIEFDGSQHYIACKKFGGETKLKRQRMNDEIKNKYCKNNNIKLIRIPYWKVDKINEILNKEFNIKGEIVNE